MTTTAATGSGWIPGQNSFTPVDLERFWGVFGQIASRLHGTRMVFRGVENCTWAVTSRLVRQFMTDNADRMPAEAEIADVEKDILSQAKSWGLGFDGGRQRSDIEMLALLQHHGIPTRLLDVTSDPMTALYFACASTASVSDDTPSALLVFLVGRMVEHPTQTWAPSGGLSYGFGWDTALGMSRNNKHPFIIRPTSPDVRQVAQRGLFLSSVIPDASETSYADSPAVGMYWSKPSKHDQLFLEFAFGEGAGYESGIYSGSPTILQLVIKPQVRTQLRRFLNNVAERTNASMYPDLAGFASHINSQRLFAKGSEKDIPS